MTDDALRRTTNAKRIYEWAKDLDAKGRVDAPIHVALTRATLMTHGFKPKQRGGPLFCGEHELVCRPNQKRTCSALQEDWVTSLPES